MKKENESLTRCIEYLVERRMKEIKYEIEVPSSGHGLNPDISYWEKRTRELFADISRSECHKLVAQDLAWRIWRENPEFAKHSLNEPLNGQPDCVAGEIRKFLKENFGAKYTKKHIADRFLKGLTPPKK